MGVTIPQLIEEIDIWLSGKSSPMAGFADYMVILARDTGIALALSVAVAQAETQCGTDPNANQLDIKGHNAWGYGQTASVSHGFLFPSWPDGINAVSERLGQFVHGLDPNYPACDTVIKLGCVWVNGDATLTNVPTNWVNNVSAIVTKFGGDPNSISKQPLTPAGGGIAPA